jgi:hypothetical protein
MEVVSKLTCNKTEHTLLGTTNLNTLNGRFHGRRPVRRPELRWEENIRRDFSLLINIRGLRRLALIGISGGELLRRQRPDMGCRATEKKNKKKQQEEEEGGGRRISERSR